jgi:hypothetical protein
VDNAASIAIANRKSAEVVIVDTSTLFYADGGSVDLSCTKAVKKWLLEMYQNTTVKIADDEQAVKFTERGFRDDLKRRGDVKRQSYAGLKDIVRRSIYYCCEPGDARHAGVNRHKTYYGAANINGDYYAMRLKINVYGSSGDIGYFKDLAAVKIKSPFLYAGGDPKKGGRTYQTKGDVLSIPIPEIKRAFDSLNKIIKSGQKVNT